MAAALLGLIPATAAAADARAGRAKAAACAICHGQNGLSTLPNAPHLAGQPAIYLEEQLKAYRSGQRRNEVMAVIAQTAERRGHRQPRRVVRLDQDRGDAA